MARPSVPAPAAPAAPSAVQPPSAASKYRRISSTAYQEEKQFLLEHLIQYFEKEADANTDPSKLTTKNSAP
ncbi:hypothetical protein TELCIR_11786 [Teladorsagia circumcincta]|uniref:Uncharacterized protein n=1 Tax=Teladorsagia circumcincta TaxID=45464 RepID=A0A2G9U9U5_TELCI|nr:hypothetical protein TELCIR_11786 [Teladorsagia circumcincta]